MGKPRLSSEIKEARGTLRPCRERAKKAEFEQLKKIPASPSTFGKAGKELWNNYGNQLAVSGVMTNVDIPAFILLCESRDRAENLKNKLTNNGKLSFAESIAIPENTPIFRAFKFEQEFSKKLIEQFGLTPRARNTIAPSAAPENENPKDKRMKELLNGEM